METKLAELKVPPHIRRSAARSRQARGPDRATITGSIVTRNCRRWSSGLSRSSASSCREARRRCTENGGTMKATLDELAAGIRSDLDTAKRIEASARRTWHCGWRAPDAAGRVFGLSQERARQLVDIAGVAKESYFVVPRLRTGESPGLAARARRRLGTALSIP
jgi:hypothetical protein